MDHYCYLCNEPTDNRWVCGTCVKRYDLEARMVEGGVKIINYHIWDDWEGLPPRMSRYDPANIPLTFRIKHDPDLLMDEGL